MQEFHSAITEMNAQQLSSAIEAYRNAIDHGKDITYGRNHDCRVDWKKQQVNVTSECGTIAISMATIVSEIEKVA